MVRFDVLRSGESTEAVFEDENAEGIAMSNQHVDTHVKLETVYQQRLQRNTQRFTSRSSYPPVFSRNCQANKKLN